MQYVLAQYTTSSPQYIAHAESVTQSVELKGVELMGAKTVPVSVKKAYQPYIGKLMSFQDIQRLALHIEMAYRSEGYILVQVILPPQEITLKTGYIRFQVVSGKINRVIFIGDAPGGAAAQLEAYAKTIEVQDPISYHSIDRFLILANNLPGIDVSATLIADKNVSGAADLVVRIKRGKVSAFINVNNRGSQSIGPYQSSIGASMYDFIGADALSATISTTPNTIKELQYGDLSYDIIVGPWATEINPEINRTNTTPGSNLASLQMTGVSTKYSLSVNQPLYSSTPAALTLQTTLYHVDTQNNLYNNSTILYQDSSSAFTLGLNYQGVFLHSYHDITVSATKGFTGFGTPSSFEYPSVENATPSFTKLNWLSRDSYYFTSAWNITTAIEAQYTNDILVSSEQIGFGGAEFGQAFPAYIISGNKGIMGAVALHYEMPLFANFTQLSPYIFYDAGAVDYQEIPGTSNDHATAQSAGIGFNLAWKQNFNMTLTAAKPLTITETPGTSLGWAGFVDMTLRI